MPDPREPDPFLDSFTGLVAARAVTSATMLGVFDALQDAPASARRAGRTARPRPARRGHAPHHPLDARLRGGRRRSLPEYRGERAPARARLARVDRDVRGRPGRPPLAGARPASGRAPNRAPVRDARGAPRRRRALGGVHPRAVRDLAAEHEANAALVPVEEPRPQVDVAGGHGAFSMAMCDRHPDACAQPSSTSRRARRSAAGSWRSRATPTASRSARATCSSSASATTTASTWSRSSTSPTTCPRSATASSAGWRARRCSRAAAW